LNQPFVIIWDTIYLSSLCR